VHGKHGSGTDDHWSRTHAAIAVGFDVGNSAHYAAVRPDRDPQRVRRFECFTADLYRLADWLQSYGVKTVALIRDRLEGYSGINSRSFARLRMNLELCA
jgi:hypothetical protein